MKKSINVLAGSTLYYLLLTAGAVFISLPVIWMVSASLQNNTDLFSPNVHILPTTLQFQNYVEVFTRFNFGNYLKNSLIVTGSVVVLNLLLTPLVGYALAKFNFPGKNLLFIFILTTIMIPFTAILVPLYLIIRAFDWVNSYQAMIVPFAMSAFGIFLMRQFMGSVPDDYLDAARIDGANELTIYARIVLPLVQPALVTLAIIVFVASWDEFLWMLIVTTTDVHRTLPVGLAKFIEQYQTRWDLMMAGSVVAASPVILMFLALQRRFLQGMAGLSGLK